MINVKFYTFQKRENSTAQPSGTATSVDCVLKDDVSIIEPVLQVEISTPIAFNYCYIADFNRYYFIRDIVANSNYLWTIYLECDVLASFKSTITASSHYVERSASEKDQYLIDTLYPTKPVVTYNNGTMSGTNPFDVATNGICYIVGILGNAGVQNGTVGSVTYYCMDDSEMRLFISYLQDTYNYWSGITVSELTEGWQKALINPFQYVVSCRAMPFPKQGTVTNNAKFGPYDYPNGLYVIPRNQVVQYGCQFTIPQHPDSSTVGKYMNCAPFSEYRLFMGPFGEIPIDSSMILDKTSLSCVVKFDPYSGDAILSVYADNSESLIQRSVHVGVEIILNGLNSNPFTSATAGMNIAGSVGLSFNPFSAGTKIWNALGSFAESKMPQLEVIGSQGSFTGWNQTVAFYAKFYQIPETNNDEYGSPLMKIKQLSTLSGFCLCNNADVQITGTREESAKINSYLNGGFFIE